MAQVIVGGGNETHLVAAFQASPAKPFESAVHEQDFHRPLQVRIVLAVDAEVEIRQRRRSLHLHALPPFRSPKEHIMLPADAALSHLATTFQDSSTHWAKAATTASRFSRFVRKGPRESSSCTQGISIECVRVMYPPSNGWLIAMSGPNNFSKLC